MEYSVAFIEDLANNFPWNHIRMDYKIRDVLYILQQHGSDAVRKTNL